MIALNFKKTWTVYRIGHWLFRFYLDKCKVMHIGHRLTGSSCIQSNKTIKATDLEIVEERDLGVLVQSDLGLSSQCSLLKLQRKH